MVTIHLKDLPQKLVLNHLIISLNFLYVLEGL